MFMNMFSRVGSFLMMLQMGVSCAFAEPLADKPAEPVPSLALYQSETHSGKTAYVDMVRLFKEYSGTKPATEVLQKEMEQKMPERQVLTAELEQLSKDNGGGAEAIKAQWQKIQLYDRQVQSALAARQTEVFAPVFESLEATVKAFGAKNGYRAIFVEPREGAEDVTGAVLKELK